ncbi:hypothetical protein [Micromonospora sp. IBHARD004]|uniref:hypothetical protein n=1 Tax=Micromonospora sp. IBHARD004 TaxID=3457764 RepID=UPI00405A31C9
MTFPDRQPDEYVAHALAELADAHAGDWRGTPEELLAYLTARLGPGHPACRYEASAKRSARASREFLRDLYGCAFVNAREEVDGDPRVRVCRLSLLGVRPALVRVIAERVLSGEGEYRATSAELRAMFAETLPDSRAAQSVDAARMAVLPLRADLAEYGIRTSRPKPARPAWIFRLSNPDDGRPAAGQ